MIRVEAGGWEGLDGMGDDILNTLRPRASVAVKSALLMAEGELKTTLTGRRSGRTYKISKTGKLHVASAPGEPPAVMFGNLRLSVGHSGPDWSAPDVVEGLWGIGLGQKPRDGTDPHSYGVRLEYGGIDIRGVKIEARPYMAPTELRVRPRIEALLESEI